MRPIFTVLFLLKSYEGSFIDTDFEVEEDSDLVMMMMINWEYLSFISMVGSLTN